MQKINLIKETEELIIKNYLSGEDIEKIAINFECSKSFIFKFLKKKNVRIRTKKIIFNKSQSTKIIKLFNKNYTIPKIAKIFGVSYSVIFKFVKVNNLKRKVNLRTIIFSQKDKETIKDLYLNKNIGTTTIGRKFNVSYSRINNELRSLNVPIKPKNFGYKLYKNDSTVFNNIDCHEKAYWIGFLMGDGTILDKKKAITLDLAVLDIDHVEKFKAFLKAENPIHKYEQICKFTNKTTYHASICVRSDELYLGAIKSGLFPRKSLKEKIPNIDPIYYNSFILGLVDADGSWFTTTQYKHKLFTFSLMSGINIIKDIQHILVKNCNLNTNKITKLDLKTGTGGTISYSGIKQTKSIYDYLYKNSPVYLERKKKIIENYFNSIK